MIFQFVFSSWIIQMSSVLKKDLKRAVLHFIHCFSARDIHSQDVYYTFEV
jgi:hypothetical protein